MPMHECVYRSAYVNIKVNKRQLLGYMLFLSGDKEKSYFYIVCDKIYTSKQHNNGRELHNTNHV